MKTIVINGIIGLDVTANDVRRELESANGQPIQADIGSPGGLIVQGIEIYNLFRQYKGQKTARIMGLAGSMAAIIPLAFDKIEVFQNSIYFVHQAITTVFDANKDDLQYRIGVLAGFDNILESALMKKSGRERKDIQGLMKNETFIFGAAIKENGFADEVLDVESEVNEELAVNNAMSEYYACAERIKNEDQQIDKIAAYLKNDVFSTPGKPAFSNIHTGGKPMDINKLKAEHLDVYQAVLDEGKKLGEDASKEQYSNEGKAAGILAERKRVTEIDALKIPEDFKAKARTADWTAEKTAFEYVNAEAVVKENIKAGMEGDLKASIASDVPKQPVDPEAKADEKVVDGKSTEDEMKTAFEKSESLRAEFGGDFARYQAFLKAETEGKVKIYRGGK